MSRNRFRIQCLAGALAFAMAPSLFSPQSWGQGTTSNQPLAKSEIRDSARFFDVESVRKAGDELTELERTRKITTVIETVHSINQGTISELVAERVKKTGVHGIYIIIDNENRKFEMVVTGDFKAAFPKTRQERVRDAFVDSFKAGKFGEGLLKGVGEIKAAVAESSTRIEPRRTADFGIPHVAPTTEAVEEGLILRNQVRLTLPGARAIIDGAQTKATELKLKMNIAVVDDGGHLLSFDRMDGARPASGYTAITKATSAATFRAETGPLPKGAAPDVLLNLSLQNAATAGGGKITTLLGGVPVLVDGQVIGGVGVGGGSGEQDAEVAKAGIAKFQAALEAK